MSAPDFKSMARNDQITLGLGLVVLIASFLPWYGYSAHVTIQGFGRVGGSSSISAWHSYSTLALLLALAGFILVALALFATSSLPDLPVAPRVIAAGLLALGTILEILRVLTLHHGDGFSVKWGAYLLIIAMIAATVLAGMAARGDMGRPRSAATPPPAV